MDEYRYEVAGLHTSTRITAAQGRAGTGRMRERQHAGGIERMRLRKLSRRNSSDEPTAATNRIGLDAAQADRLAQCAKVMANVYDAKLPV